MSLHTADKVPDWEQIPAEERNCCQRVAAWTNGWVTPGNALTLAGAALTLSANRDIQKKHYGKAAAKMFAGRVIDMVDGKVADITGTKSPLGEGFDASVDKFLALVTVLTMRSEGIITPRDHDTIVAQQSLSFAMSAVAKITGKELHPSREGKEDMTAAWLHMGSSLVGRAFEDHDQPVGIGVSKVLSETAIQLSRYACAPVALRGYAADII